MGALASSTSIIGTPKLLSDQDYNSAYTELTNAAQGSKAAAGGATSDSSKLIQRGWKLERELGAKWDKHSSGVGVEEEEFNINGDDYNDMESDSDGSETGSVMTGDSSGGEEDDGGARHVEAVIAYSIPGVGGHHYVRGNVGMMEGMWAWTVSIEEDIRGDMHTLLGVCFEDVKQAKYDQAREMLLVAGWSGRAYK